MKPAGWLERIAAAVLDLIIVSVGTSVIAWPFLRILDFEAQAKSLTTEALRMQENPDSFDPELLKSMLIFLFWLFALMLVLLFVMHVYYIYFESSESGQTPGKKALGIRVVDLEGRRITRTQAVYREALRWYVDGLFVLPAFFAMAMTPRRQRVGDIAAGTMVIELPPRS
jgi:uncharacterized RDD family membrane protein YckC